MILYFIHELMKIFLYRWAIWWKDQYFRDVVISRHADSIQNTRIVEQTEDEFKQTSVIDQGNSRLNIGVQEN